MPPVPIDESARKALARYDWPGNVRELRNVIERTLILGAFPNDFGGLPAATPESSGDSLEAIERKHILSVLRETGGNRDEAARKLGISRKTIDRKCSLWNV
jgi:DNA-binding NtrC family response regulator